MFNYFTDIIVLIFLGFAIVYPFFLWIAPLKKIDSGFYRFNLGMCCVVGAMGISAFDFLDPSFISKIYVWVWFSTFMIITALYWNSEHINNVVISAIALFGTGTMLKVVAEFISEGSLPGVWFVVLLGSAITAAVFFAMILGHWYLNVIALPIQLLKKATLGLWGLLFLRSVWDIVYLSTNTIIDTFGISHSLWSFMFQFDGFLLAVAFFMGNIVPIILNFFIWRTLNLQATQSATGLLYVAIVSILFGDLLFKYYLLQYGFLV
ncbi:MAG: hypothetical protein ISR82_03585 [Candidatus Marinimicrobia bacterium]|nr:hypothetical protein [Candidatus Neomarinimicrobiota bacterium]MBL7010286.1 hypothetical protein [Candidatus Neomarinimicrobiota bacterium]MBL7030192.1 hypothetical protein [Candidatus Neomarinimicrobiota bacterium]